LCWLIIRWLFLGHSELSAIQVAYSAETLVNTCKTNREVFISSLLRVTFHNVFVATVVCCWQCLQFCTNTPLSEKEQGFNCYYGERVSIAVRELYFYRSFIYSPTDALVNCLKNNIKIYIKITPTCFGVVTPSSGSALIRVY